MDQVTNFFTRIADWFKDVSPQTLIIMGLVIFIVIFLINWTRKYVADSLEAQARKEERERQAKLRVSRVPPGRAKSQPAPANPSAALSDDITAYKDVVYAPAPLVTPEDLAIWPLLSQAAPGCHIFPQVALSRLIQAQCPDRDRLRNVLKFIADLKADFVICGPGLEVLALVELTAGEPGVKARKKEAIAGLAGYRCLFLDGRKPPTVDQLKQMIFPQSAAASAAASQNSIWGTPGK